MLADRCLGRKTSTRNGAVSPQGATNFLSKPVNLQELQMRVSSMLRTRRLTNDLEDANRQLQTPATADPLTRRMNRRVLDARLDPGVRTRCSISVPSGVREALRAVEAFLSKRGGKVTP